jgi:CheY-like chemotaxis protein
MIRAQGTAARPETAHVLRRPFILVIDDEHDLREVLSEILTSDGYLVIAAHHGADALAKIDAAGALPDLILVDLMMPVMDGAAFLGKLAERGGAQAKVPVIVLSAAVQASQYVPAGIEVFRKPIDLDALLERIGVVCGGLKATP